MKQLGLIPLRNFAVVEEGKIYRSAQPIYAYEYRWLHDTLGINMLVNLRDDVKHDEKMVNFVGSNIVVINIEIPDHGIPTLQQCYDFIDMIKSGDHFPLLFHCEHGHGRTSTFCVLTRLAQGWDLNDAIREEEEKFHYNFKHAAQKQFLIENFGENERI